MVDRSNFTQRVTFDKFLEKLKRIAIELGLI
jgi:hypothetical protein